MLVLAEMIMPSAGGRVAHHGPAWTLYAGVAVAIRCLLAGIAFRRRYLTPHTLTRCVVYAPCCTTRHGVTRYPVVGGS